MNIGTITSGSGSQRLAHAMSKLHGMVVMLMGARVERTGGRCVTSAWGAGFQMDFRLLPSLSISYGLKLEPKPSTTACL